MFIRKLEIKNFQCHEHLLFDLNEGVNAITGESDQGKSAIIRALRWLIFNKPDGQQYRKHGTKETVVRVVLDNGTAVARVRSSAINRYVLEIKGSETQVYDSFGRDIPEPIVNAFGISPAVFSEDVSEELSISKQFDGPFLLSASGIVKAQVLGTLSKTSILDTAVRMVGSDIRLRGRHANLMSADIEKSTAELDNFGDLEGQSERVAKIEKSFEKLNIDKIALNNVINIDYRLDELAESMVQGRRQLSALSDFPDLDQLESDGIVLQRLIEIYFKINEINKTLPEMEAAIQKINKLTPEVLDDLSNQGQILQGVSKLHEEASEWKRTYMANTKRMTETIEEINLSVTNMQIKIRTEGVCPTCYRDIDDYTLARISEELRA